MGEGKSSQKQHTKKRQRSDDVEAVDDEVLEEMEVGGGAEGSDEERGETVKQRDGSQRRQSKQRRIETLGQKKVGKEHFKNNKDRQKLNGSSQWSR